MHPDTESWINKIVMEALGATEDQVRPTSLLVGDLGADSLDQVELVMAVEDEFDIEISDEETGAALKVSDLYDIVSKHIEGK